MDDSTIQAAAVVVIAVALVWSVTQLITRRRTGSSS